MKVNSFSKASMPAGYQKTEAGTIPEDWGVSTVGREFDIKLGKMLDSEKNVGTPKPYLGNRAVQWGCIDISDLPLVPMTRSDIETYRLREGDLLVCEGGEVGRAALWNSPVEECYYQKALHRLRPRRGFEPRLMVALLRQWVDRGALANYVTQTSIAHLPRERFMDVPMPVPPAPEQHAIAEALGDVDALLGALDQLISKKRDLKQAAMQQLLTGQTRLPGFYRATSASFKKTAMGMIPADWQEVTIGERTLKVGSGITPTGGSRVYRQSGRPFVRSQNVGWGRLVLDDIAFIDDETHRRFSDTEIKMRDVLLNITGASIGRCAVAEARIVGGNVNQHVCVIRSNPAELDPLFLNRVLLADLGQRQIDSFQAGGNREGLNFGQIRSLRIPLPPLSEQTAIAAVLTDTDAELALLEQRLSKTRVIKQGMMQELLTGKTRLVAPQEPIA